MKLYDIDIYDFFSKNYLEILKEIFITKLWNNELKNQNNTSIYVTMVARPIDIGGRYPLDPNEKEW